MTHAAPRVAIVVAILLAPITANAKPAKLRVDVQGGHLELTYESAKISEADLRAAATLSPDAYPDGDNTESLDTCRDAAGAKIACGDVKQTPALATFFRDADVTIARNREIVRAATERKVAPELAPAKEWLRAHTALWAGLAEHELAFYRSWKIADLSTTIEGIDAGTACAAILARIDAAPSHDAKYQLAKRDWHNCVNDHFATAHSYYPREPWLAFLKAHGVTSKHVDIDD